MQETDTRADLLIVVRVHVGLPVPAQAQLQTGSLGELPAVGKVERIAVPFRRRADIAFDGILDTGVELVESEVLRAAAVIESGFLAPQAKPEPQGMRPGPAQVQSCWKP